MSTAHLSDSMLYGHLWSTSEVHDLFDDEARIATWLEILVALAQSQAEVGLIPEQAASLIQQHAKAGRLDLEEIAERTRVTGHSTLGLIQHLRSMLPDEAAEWIYYGATVQDLTDTWTAIVMGRVLDIVDRDLSALMSTLATLAERHANTLMCGRSHGQPGLPITFGFKVAVWLSEALRHKDRLAEIRPRCMVAQLGGALGTMEFWDDQGVRLLESFARRIGLGVPDIAWLTARDGVAEFLNVLAMITATLGKIGQEVYDLQRPEIGEVTESWRRGQVGSITMPHKRNPEASEHLVTLSRLVRLQAAAGLEAMVHEHERDGRAWKTEWIVLPEACMFTAVALQVARELVAGLQVHPLRMRQNVEANAGYLMSERVMRVLADRVGKHRAHELVYEAVMRGQDGGISFRDAILEDDAVMDAMTSKELDDCLDTALTTRPALRFVDRVLSRTKGEQAK